MMAIDRVNAEPSFSNNVRTTVGPGDKNHTLRGIELKLCSTKEGVETIRGIPVANIIQSITQ